jgi:hypothetical protein
MNANRQLGQSTSRDAVLRSPSRSSQNSANREAPENFPASLFPCILASLPTQQRAPTSTARITSHKSRITAFLIDIAAIRNRLNPFAFNASVASNRHAKGPFPFCTIGAQPAKVPCSLRDLVCYSHRRTRVPPPGLRAIAPARPTWCEGLPLLCHGEIRLRRIQAAARQGLVFPSARDIDRKHPG